MKDAWRKSVPGRGQAHAKALGWEPAWDVRGSHCVWMKLKKGSVEGFREEAGSAHVSLVGHFKDFAFYFERDETLQECLGLPSWC